MKPCDKSSHFEGRLPVRFVAVASLAGLVGFAVVSANAAPMSLKSTPIEVGANSSTVLVRDGCGHGWHRAGWYDKRGRWHWGDCVPNGNPHPGWGARWDYGYPVWRGPSVGWYGEPNWR
jgi:hypothetical protein